MQRIGVLNGNGNNNDYDYQAGISAILNKGVVSGLAVSTNSVAAGSALISVTRSGKTFLITYENTAAVTIDTTGTKKVWIGVYQAKIDNNDGGLEDGTGVASIQTGASYPGSGSYIKLASITGGVITDERSFIRLKDGLPMGMTIKPTDGTDVDTFQESGIYNCYYSDTSKNNPIGGVLQFLVIASENKDRITQVAYTMGYGNSVDQQYMRTKNLTVWSPWKHVYPISGSTLTAALAQIGLAPQRIPVVYAEASSAAGKIFSVESQAYAYTPTGEVAFGNTASNTRIAIPFYHSGLSTTQLKMYLRKVGAPTDNAVIRIETDSGSDSPSGTLVHANATYNVAGTGLTTSHAVSTGTMTAWNATRGQKLWIVLSRQNANDGANYYMLGTIPLDTRIFMGYKLYNASWSAKTAISIYFESTACEFVAVLASTASGRTKASGFSDGVYSAGGTGYLSIGKSQTVTGVTKNNYYSLSATAGDLQVTPASTNAIGFCGEDTSLVLMDDVLYIPGYFYQNAIGDNTAFSGQQVRAQFYCKSGGTVEGSGNTTITHNSGGGSYSIGVLRAGVWTNVSSGSRVFAGETVGFIVNGSGGSSSYVQFDWNIRFTPSF